MTSKLLRIRIIVLPFKHLGFSREECKPWKSFIHPEGLRYNRARFSNIAFSTDADIYKGRLLEKVNYLVENIHCRILLAVNANTISLTPTDAIEVVIDHRNEDDPEWGYYIVSHSLQSIFWFEEYELGRPIRGGDDHIRDLSMSTVHLMPLNNLN